MVGQPYKQTIMFHTADTEIRTYHWKRRAMRGDICVGRQYPFAGNHGKRQKLGLHLKKVDESPKVQRLKVLHVQTKLMIIWQRITRIFGDLEYLMFHSKLLDMFLFPLGKSRKLCIMAVAVKELYNHQEIAKNTGRSEQSNYFYAIKKNPIAIIK
jgi:hypothetical protein